MLLKKVIVLLTALLACAGAHAIPDGEEGQTVVIRESLPISGPAVPPKAPTVVPIECSYFPSNASVEVCFLSDLGSVSIEIENQTAGTYAQMIVNGSQGVHPFFISGASGHWMIMFTLSNGKRYIGEFDIN